MAEHQTPVTLPAWIINDLMEMARSSKAYRDGYDWAAVAMNTANQAVFDAEQIERHKAVVGAA